VPESLLRPVLILFFHVTPAYAVGTALAFGVAVKLLVVPMQLFRKQVDFRVLGYMLAGGLPGVLIGSAILSKLNRAFASRHFIRGARFDDRSDGGAESLSALDSADSQANCRPVALAALYHSARSAPKSDFPQQVRARWVPWWLLAITPLTAAQVVGTDLFFGLCVGLVGTGFQLTAGNFDSAILVKLVIGGLAGAFAGTTSRPWLPNESFAQPYPSG